MTRTTIEPPIPVDTMAPRPTLLRSINRMNDLIPDTRTEGELIVDGASVTGRFG